MAARKGAKGPRERPRTRRSERRPAKMASRELHVVTLSIFHIVDKDLVSRHDNGAALTNASVEESVSFGNPRALCSATNQL